MTLADTIILICVGIILSLICYFHFWKNRKNPCKGCAYAKNCNKKCDSKKNIKDLLEK